MADPRNELADIVVPLAPTLTQAADGGVLWWIVAGLVGVVVVAMVFGWWHRGRFVRSLQAITHAVARQQGTPDVLAGLLDAWARGRFRMIRLEVLRSPNAMAADEWAEWVNALSSVRFAPVPPDAWDTLSHLCETAQQWKRNA